MKYFTGCTTQEELKKEYRRLCKELHPDNGGDPEEFKTMQADFEAAGNGEAWRTFTNNDGERYQKETTETAAEFMSIIEALGSMEGVTIEICGSWLWVSGNTFPHREALKRAGLKFSRNKSAWYFHKDKYRKRSKKYMSLDAIRDLYGAETVEPIKRTAIAY